MEWPHLWIWQWIKTQILRFYFVYTTEYGLPKKLFFIETPNYWAWADKFWKDKFWGIWGIFGHFIRFHLGTVSSLSTFSINRPLFLQKTKPLYPNLKYLSGIGIWIWAAKNYGFSHPSCVRSPWVQYLPKKPKYFLSIDMIP